MGYRLVADAAMVAHFAFLAYLTVGGFLAWRWPRSVWVHVAVALYGLGNAVVGWTCPLTLVEDWGRSRAGEASLPASGFIDHYVAGVVYPREHAVLAQVVVAVVVLVSWVGVVVLRRRRHTGEEARADRTGTEEAPRPLA